MKKLLLSAALASTTLAASAQYADGEIFPDFTAQDINGNTHQLYDYLDQGYTVIIDFSAAWCSTCWWYHEQGVLDDIYENHGPSGMTNVSPSTTDDVMVIFIEAETTNSATQLNGTTTAQTYAGYTEGDWVTGTLFPIIDANSSVAGLMNSNYFPTLYVVYPDRTVYEGDFYTATGYYNLITGNVDDHSASTGGHDADVLTYLGETKTCGTVDMDVRVQNKGDQTLPAGATIEILQGGNVVGTGATSTALDQWEIETVTVSATVSSTTNLSIEVTANGDVNTNNGTQSATMNLADESTTTVVTIQIATDQYGGETSWTLKDGNNTTVASGSGYSNQSSDGVYPQADVDVTVDNSQCYTLQVNDSWGDGMNSSYGEGYIRVVDGNGNVMCFVDEFGDTAFDYFLTGTATDAGTFSNIDENVLTDLNVYPNPSSSIATISFENGTATETEIQVTNMVGQIIVNEYLGEVVGIQNFELNGNDLEAGIYMVTVKAGTKVVTKRVVLSK